MSASLLDGLRRRFHMQEVGPRDGLQPKVRFVPTADTIDLVNAPLRASFAKIEATAFVSPAAIPQLRDAARMLPPRIGPDLPSRLLKAGRRLDLHLGPGDWGAIRAPAVAKAGAHAATP